MSRQITKPLRRCDSRSWNNLKSDPQLKSMIKNELRDMINHSVHEYLQHHRVPVAAIDIKVDKDCKHCLPDHSHGQSPRNIRLNISTSTIDREIQPNIPNSIDKEVVKNADEDYVHWMTWKDPTPFFTKKRDLRNYRMQTAKNPPPREHRCQSPFARPRTSFYQKNNNNNNNAPDENPPLQYRPSSCEPTKRVRCMSVNQLPVSSHQKMSVAVGPDKQLQTTATNTQKTYQISDYLKKSLDLNDPYERQVFSSLMEVLRKRNRSNKSIDTESIAGDHIVQLSEYKSKYRNPQSKSMNFPTSNVENKIPTNRPPLCPHKTRPLGQLRPPSSNNNRFGEQYLY